MFWVYVLQNPNGHFYVGHTDNLQNQSSPVIIEQTRSAENLREKTGRGRLALVGRASRSPKRYATRARN